MKKLFSILLLVITATLAGQTGPSTTFNGKVFYGYRPAGTGNTTLLTLNTLTNQLEFQEAVAGIALGETSTTAYRGDRGKIAYDHSQTTGNPHNTQISQISGLQPALDLKAPLASPALTGGPTAPTAAPGTNTTQLANTAFVQNALTSAINGVVAQTITDGVTTSAPSQDAVYDALFLKANIASPTFTGIPAVPTATAGTNTTQAASTAFVSTTLATKQDILVSGTNIKTINGSTVLGSGNLQVGNLLQGGNSFGSQMVVGTNDAQSLDLRTNSASRLTITDSGSTFKTLSVFQGDIYLGANSFRYGSSDVSQITLGTQTNSMNFLKGNTTSVGYLFTIGGGAATDFTRYVVGTTTIGGVRVDGRTYGANGSATNDYYTFGQATTALALKSDDSNVIHTNSTPETKTGQLTVGSLISNGDITINNTVKTTNSTVNLQSANGANNNRLSIMSSGANYTEASFFSPVSGVDMYFYGGANRFGGISIGDDGLGSGDLYLRTFAGGVVRNAVIVKGATGFIGFNGVTSPTRVLDAGTSPIKFGVPTLSTDGVNRAYLESYVAKTSNYTLVDSDGVVDFTSGSNTATLPTAVGIPGKKYLIKNTGTGATTIATTSSQTIDGNSNLVLFNRYSVAELTSDGANWKITGTYNTTSVVNTAMTTAQTAATLNSTYPSAGVPFTVFSPNVGTGMVYIKTTTGGQWMQYSGSLLNP